MMNFLLQSNDSISKMEKAAVRHACALNDSLRVLGFDDARKAIACPVGSVEFCMGWMRLCRIDVPEPIDYPDCLRFALGRPILKVPFGEARVGCWIKPVETKAFEPRVMTGDEPIAPDELVWECTPIAAEAFIAEWRVYVLWGKIVGQGRYDAGEDESATLDTALVQSWVNTYTNNGQAPAGYALDVARMADGRIMLVEVTDGWAIGYYRGTCSSVDYARLLAARWDDIAARAMASSGVEAAYVA